MHAWTLYGESVLAHGRGSLPSDRLSAVIDQEHSRRRQWLEGLVDTYRNSLQDTEVVGFSPKLELLRGDPAIVIPQRIAVLPATGFGTFSASSRALACNPMRGPRNRAEHRLHTSGDLRHAFTESTQKNMGAWIGAELAAGASALNGIWCSHARELARQCL